jgi:3-oxoacyl-(acyl-carrier-protein) synthase
MSDKTIILSMGSISALGSHPEEVWKNYLNGFPRIGLCCYNNCNTPVGKLHLKEEELIKSIRTENSHYRRLDKTVLLSIIASRQAVKNGGWENKNDISINIGSSRGATHLFEKYHKHFIENTGKRLNPNVSPTTTLGNISSWTGHDLKYTGSSFSHSITCSTALHAILNGKAWIDSGMASRFIAGGSEASLSDFTIAQMSALRIYSQEKGPYPSLPLESNKKNNSMVLGEGSAVFCLEKDADQERIAVIEGIGFATEPIQHNTSLSANADCLRKSMKMALKDAQLTQVDSIVMHAPGTLRGDESEIKAIKNLFSDNIPHLISTKHLSGHTFGASGALSLELAILMLQKQQSVLLPYPSVGGKNLNKLDHVMVNSTGFGGNAVSIILSK